ncbi:imelysin family protein [Pollutimonas bauzanensis]|uniref:imelysin family protein n=1 Tax=Pollutimonas bauzanensis TaxID=658167 RepID=UPI00333F9B09
MHTRVSLFRPLLLRCLGSVFLFPMAMVNAGELSPDLGASLVNSYISPAMRHFQHSAHSLHATLETWCAQPQKSGAKTVHEGFAALVGAWSGIEFLRFGPLVAANRYERINFWPDPRGITLRQVQALLAAADPVSDAAQLAGQSVAIQGLPALEYVLYRDKGLLTDPAHAGNASACAYASAVAGNLAILGSELVSEWKPGGDYAQRFSRPSASNSLYRNQQEVAGESIKALSTGLQFVRDVKLLPVLGRNINAVKPKRAPFWRSGLAVQSMAAGTQGMLQFYKAGQYKYGSNETWIDASLQAELLRINANFNAIQIDASQAATSPGPEQWLQFTTTEAGYRQLTLASLLIKNAKSLVDENVAPAFGVRIGFNALDGD